MELDQKFLIFMIACFLLLLISGGSSKIYTINEDFGNSEPIANVQILDSALDGLSQMEK